MHVKDLTSAEAENLSHLDQVNHSAEATEIIASKLVGEGMWVTVFLVDSGYVCNNHRPKVYLLPVEGGVAPRVWGHLRFLCLYICCYPALIAEKKQFKIHVLFGWVGWNMSGKPRLSCALIAVMSVHGFNKQWLELQTMWWSCSNSLWCFLVVTAW